MTARRLMVVLAGSFALVPLALAQDHAVSRGGSSAPAHSGASGPSASAVPSGGGSAGGFDVGTWSRPAQPVAMARDHAVSRGSSSSSKSKGGSSSSKSASSRSSGKPSSSSSKARARSSSKSSSSRRHAKPGASAAERRHPRAGTGRAGGGYYYRNRYYPYRYYPHSYGYYYPGWGWGSYWWPYGSYYDGWYGGGYWGYPYGGWVARHSYVHRDVGSVRVLVNPAEARVYVDGYYAGTVDDFDGLFQRLNVSPGRHEITLKLEGYKTHRIKVYVPFDGTLKLHFDMEKGSGETFEDQAVDVPESELAREREFQIRLQREGEQAEREQEEGEQEEGDEDGEEALEPVTLRLKVTPLDASVYIDGAFRGTGREAAPIELPPGLHKIEIVRPGYRTVEREVDTTAGEPTELTIELERTTI